MVHNRAGSIAIASNDADVYVVLSHVSVAESLADASNASSCIVISSLFPNFEHPTLATPTFMRIPQQHE